MKNYCSIFWVMTNFIVPHKVKTKYLSFHCICCCT